MRFVSPADGAGKENNVYPVGLTIIPHPTEPVKATLKNFSVRAALALIQLDNGQLRTSDDGAGKKIKYSKILTFNTFNNISNILKFFPP